MTNVTSKTKKTNRKTMTEASAKGLAAISASHCVSSSDLHTDASSVTPPPLEVAAGSHYYADSPELDVIRSQMPKAVWDFLAEETLRVFNESRQAEVTAVGLDQARPRTAARSKTATETKKAS